jgi:hypothetical protein
MLYSFDYGYSLVFLGKDYLSGEGEGGCVLLPIIFFQA